MYSLLKAGYKGKQKRWEIKKIGYRPFLMIKQFGKEQGDQIVRIFAHWYIVYFGQFFEIYRSSPNFGATLLNGKSYAHFFTKK
jgi:hypothetical protein